jgi:hypothetical protein
MVGIHNEQQQLFFKLLSFTEGLLGRLFFPSLGYSKLVSPRKYFNDGYSCLLAYNAMQSGIILLTFRRSVLSPPSG